MRTAFPILIVIALVVSGCTHTEDFETLDRRAQLEAATGKPVERKLSDAEADSRSAKNGREILKGLALIGIAMLQGKYGAPPNSPRYHEIRS